jgi:Rrf2 family protein
MKLTSHEEYGLRCLLQIAQEGPAGTLTIPQISEREGLSEAYVAKLLRILRMGGFVQSSRGPVGGYGLSRPPEKIVVGDVLSNIGGRLVESDFCDSHAGQFATCVHVSECSIRPLWTAIQTAVDRVLNSITLKDLMTGDIPGQTALPLVQLEAAPLAANK